MLISQDMNPIEHVTFIGTALNLHIPTQYKLDCTVRILWYSVIYYKRVYYVRFMEENSFGSYVLWNFMVNILFSAFIDLPINIFQFAQYQF